MPHNVSLIRGSHCLLIEGSIKILIKVRKVEMISNRYNQVPHLLGMITWESDITNKVQEVSPFPAGDHNAAMDRRESITNTSHKYHK